MKAQSKEGRDRLRSVVLCLIALGFLVGFPYGSFGKIKLPAEIVLELTQPATPGHPLNILVTASSKIPFNGGSITLAIPSIDTEPSRNVVLWSGSTDAPTTQTLKYTLSPLPIGKYEFRVSFEFTPTTEGARQMRVGQNLYVDVRTSSILSSNISFTQIRRIELKNELERRGLSTMPEAEQKALAPDLKERIEELNRLETVPLPPENDSAPEKMIPGLQKAPLEGTKNAVPGSLGPEFPKKISPSVQKAPLQGIKVGSPE